MKMSLQDWLKNGWLTEHQTSLQEIKNLLVVAERDLNDCRTARKAGLSPDWQLNIAYNAALQLATAALAATGYRDSREAHHYRVVRSLAYTIGADASVVTRLDRFRKKRNYGHDHILGRDPGRIPYPVRDAELIQEPLVASAPGT